MNEEVQLKIQAWVDGELSGWQARNVAKLVERDAEAKALATELQHTKAAMATNEVAVAVPELREFYWNKIRLQIEREEAAGHKRAPAASFDPLAVLRRLALPLAGVAVACAVAMLSLNQFSGPENTDSTTTTDEMSALTFHDQSAGMTIVWLQDNSNNDQPAQPAKDDNSSDSDDVI